MGSCHRTRGHEMEITYNIIKAMWRRYRSGKNKKDFEITVGLSRTIHNSYQQFENRKHSFVNMYILYYHFVYLLID